MIYSGNIIDMEDRRKIGEVARKLRPHSHGNDGSGNPPYDGGMEQRVAALEGFASDAKEKLARIETKVDALATKAELESIRSDFLKVTIETKKWMITTIIGLFLGFGSLFFTMSNFLKPATPTTQPAQAPIIINVPASQPAAAPAPTSAPAK